MQMLERPAFALNGFAEFYAPLHERFAQRCAGLVEERARVLRRAHDGTMPGYLPFDKQRPTDWRIALPPWCGDQRNQMTGPADDAELVSKLVHSGAPGVMLDLEDSIVNETENVLRGHANMLEALYSQPQGVVVWNRVRGLHLLEAGMGGEALPAALFDVALLAHRVDIERLEHNTLCLYIPKSESAEEALWWSDVFDAIVQAKRWPEGSIKCMALVESHPLAYQLEEFAYNLRRYLVGLNLGRWDYMASLIDFTLGDERWLLPDRNSIPFDVAFFQRLRVLLPQVCHRHGMLAIGGMTALFPSRQDAELNARALAVLARDKKNEAEALMDGAWTGHPDQNQIAVAQFPFPNQLDKLPDAGAIDPDLRPLPAGVGKTTLQGTRDAVRTVIRYRKGVLDGNGASLLDGYMEDLATDRIYRLMIVQRMRYPGEYAPARLETLFEEELERIVSELPPDAETDRQRYHRASLIAQKMIATSLSSLQRE